VSMLWVIDKSCPSCAMNQFLSSLGPLIITLQVQRNLNTKDASKLFENYPADFCGHGLMAVLNAGLWQI